jgi:hypothetical protein
VAVFVLLALQIMQKCRKVTRVCFGSALSCTRLPVHDSNATNFFFLLWHCILLEMEQVVMGEEGGDDSACAADVLVVSG